MQYDSIALVYIQYESARINKNSLVAFFTLVSTLNDGVGMDIGWYFYLFIEV